MDQVFIEGGTARRKFFDRLVYGFAPEHATRLCALDGLQRTIYVSGFAKILAPSWRVGCDNLTLPDGSAPGPPR